MGLLHRVMRNAEFRTEAMECVLGSPVQGELSAKLTEGLYPRQGIAFTPIYCPTIFLRASVSGAILTPFLL